MKISRTVVVLDAADLATESAFWAGVLGGTVKADDDWHYVYVDGEERLGIQLAPEHTPPEWPEAATRLGALSHFGGAEVVPSVRD